MLRVYVASSTVLSVLNISLARDKEGQKRRKDRNGAKEWLKAAFVAFKKASDDPKPTRENETRMGADSIGQVPRDWDEFGELTK